MWHWPNKNDLSVVQKTMCRMSKTYLYTRIHICNFPTETIMHWYHIGRTKHFERVANSSLVGTSLIEMPQMRLVFNAFHEQKSTSGMSLLQMFNQYSRIKPTDKTPTKLRKDTTKKRQKSQEIKRSSRSREQEAGGGKRSLVLPMLISLAGRSRQKSAWKANDRLPFLPLAINLSSSRFSV